MDKVLADVWGGSGGKVIDISRKKMIRLPFPDNLPMRKAHCISLTATLQTTEKGKNSCSFGNRTSVVQPVVYYISHPG
jgi:hypothetical protein